MAKRIVGAIICMLLLVPIGLVSAQSNDTARYAGKKVLYVSDQAHTGAVSDQKGAAHLGEKGADVTLIDQENAGNYQPDEFDLVIISSTVNSGMMGAFPQYFQTKTPVLNWEAYLLGQNQFALANPGLTSTNSIRVIPVPHPITSGFQDDVQIADLPIAEVHVGTPNAPGLNVLAIAASGNEQVGALFFVEEGGLLSNGEPSLNRVLHFPGSDHLFDEANENLLTLFFQSVDWLLGIPADA